MKSAHKPKIAIETCQIIIKHSKMGGTLVYKYVSSKRCANARAVAFSHALVHVCANVSVQLTFIFKYCKGKARAKENRRNNNKTHNVCVSFECEKYWMSVHCSDFMFILSI